MAAHQSLAAEFGPVYLREPGPINSASLEAQLPIDLRQRLHQTREALRTWDLEAPHKTLLSALAILFPGDFAAVYPAITSPSPKWFFHSLDGVRANRPPAKLATSQMPSMRLYYLQGDDPFANRAVNLSTLCLHPSSNEDDSVVQALLEVLLHPIGVHHQLRTMLYRDGEAWVYLGIYRRRQRAAFSIQEHVLLDVIQPDVREWLNLAHGLGFSPIGDNALITTLEHLSQPAYLEAENQLLYANPLGRALPLDSFRAKKHTMQAVSIAPVEVPMTLYLDKTQVRQRVALPPSLQQAANLLEQGKSNKEIAQELGVTLNTARTYVSRIFQKLKVHDRRELIRR